MFDVTINEILHNLSLKFPLPYNCWTLQRR